MCPQGRHHFLPPSPRKWQMCTPEGQLFTKPCCLLQERDPGKLLKSLASTMRQRHCQFHHAVFTPPDSVYGKLKASGSGAKDLSWQQTLREAWMVQSPQQDQVFSENMLMLCRIRQEPLQGVHLTALPVNHTKGHGCGSCATI